MTTQSAIRQGEQYNENNQPIRRDTTAKIHVSKEIANLLKIYCVLKNKKMTEYATEVLENELKHFGNILARLEKSN